MSFFNRLIDALSHHRRGRTSMPTSPPTGLAQRLVRALGRSSIYPPDTAQGRSPDGSVDNSISSPKYDYDIAISFGDGERQYIEAMVRAAKERGLRVFYDQNDASMLWGKNIVAELRQIYGNAAYVLVFVSAEYLESTASADELALTAANAPGGQAHILPVLTDDATVPKLWQELHINYLSAKRQTPEQLAQQLWTTITSGGDADQ